MSKLIFVVLLCAVFLISFVVGTNAKASSSLTVSADVPTVTVSTVLAQTSYGGNEQESRSSSSRGGRGLFRLGKLAILGIIGGVYWLVKWSLFDD